MTAHLVAASGEFIGTVLFLWFAFAWHQVAVLLAAGSSSRGGSSAETVMFISIGYGFSLLVNAWAFYRISGGLFNPAVVLGMVLSGTMPAMRGLFLFPAQLLGGIVAAALSSCMFPTDIDDVQTRLAPGVSVARGVFIEMFLTTLLLFTIHMLAAEKWKATFIAPVGIGLALFVAELAGVYFTGGSLNPARSFGPAVVATSFEGYHWIYWVGPALGSLITAAYFRFVKAVNYEEVNAGQESADGDFS